MSTESQTSQVRYFYRREDQKRLGKERIITVAYRHNQDTGETSYGATIFRKDSPSDTFSKKTHRGTANSRLDKRPVIITIDGAATLDEVEDEIRSAIRTYGVSGSRND